MPSLLHTKTVGSLRVWNEPADIQERIDREVAFVTKRNIRRHPRVLLFTKKPSTFSRRGGPEEQTFNVPDILGFEKAD